MHFFAQAPGVAADLWPFAVLFISFGAIIFMAIGFGAMMLSWMNDSGFWVVGKLSGFTEKETLKSWTVAVSVNSLVGLIACLILAWLLPFAQKP